jgi:hypothetical protein
MHDRVEAIKDAHAKTFSWIFEEPDGEVKQWNSFSWWLRSGDGIYWISGKAGSGKSTLMRYISQHPRLQNQLQDWAGTSRDLVIGSFFFWIGGVHDQASHVGLLRSLLFTLLSSRQHLIQSTLPGLWSDLKSSIAAVEYAKAYSWTLPKLTNGFQQLFSQDVGHVFLLIDGLDEYQGDPAETVEILQSIVSPKVKICLSSRPWQVFEDAFRETPKLRLQDVTFGDISRYVNEVLGKDKRMKDLCASDPEAPKLVDEIVAKADGVFLWVTLVVKSLLNGLTNRDKISHLRKRLEEIPPQIEDLYSFMLNKIEPIYYEEGSRIFSTVALALQRKRDYEGVSIGPLHLSFAIEDDCDLKAPTQLLSMEEIDRRVGWIDVRLKVSCAGLLELPSVSGIGVGYFSSVSKHPRVEYIHRTARDFLATRESKTIPILKHRSTTFNPATNLVRANVLYLKHMQDLVRNFDYLDDLFKGTMWLAHKAESETGHVQEEVLDELERVFINFKKHQHPLHIVGLSNKISWTLLMPAVLDRDQETFLQYDDYISVAISWGLSLYFERKLGNGTGFLNKKRGMPYSDYIERTPRISPDEKARILALLNNMKAAKMEHQYKGGIYRLKVKLKFRK